MRRRVHKFVGAFLAIIALVATGAAHAAAPVPDARPIYFEHLTMRDGLSQSTVNDVLQDSQGYLWLATESGLDRYDGHHVVSFRADPADPSSLSGSWVTVLFQDRGGAFWVGTRAGLNRFFFANPEYALSTIAIQTDGSLQRDQILKTAELREGLNIFSVNLAQVHDRLQDLAEGRTVHR